MRQAEIKSSEQKMLAEVQARREEWQESFRAELRRDLIKESSLETIRVRMKLYGAVWKSLKITAGHEWKKLQDPKAAVQKLADELTDFAYSDFGLVMSDRSRRLLTHLRSGCGDYLRGNIDQAELKNRAHLLKHSMRSDLGIITEEYESDLHQIAEQVGRVDDWREKK